MTVTRIIAHRTDWFVVVGLLIGSLLAGLLLAAGGSAAGTDAQAHENPTAGVNTAHSPAQPMQVGHVAKSGLPDSPAMAKGRGETQAAPGGIATHRHSSTTSNNWSGLVAGAKTGTFQGVSGTWHVPQVYVSAQNRYGSTWVGVDGSGTSSLIQAGTEEDYLNGHAYYTAWWEILPAVETIIKFSNGTPVPVAPGDYMYSYIYQTSPGVFRIFLDDLTQRWYYDATHSYSGPEISVDWIQEATQIGGVIQKPTNFGTVGFGDMYVMENGAWYNTNLSYGNEWNIVQNGVQYTSVNAPTATQPQTFTDKYVGP